MEPGQFMNNTGTQVEYVTYYYINTYAHHVLSITSGANQLLYTLPY